MERITAHLTEEISASLAKEAEELGCSPQALLSALARHGLSALSFSAENALSTPRRRDAVAEDARRADGEIEDALGRGGLGRQEPAATRRTYSRTSRAPFGALTLRGEPYEEEIFVSLRDRDEPEGSYAEFAIRWYLLTIDGPALRIECFARSLGFLLSCTDLLAVIRHRPTQDTWPDDVEAVLKELGFEDEHPPC